MPAKSVDAAYERQAMQDGLKVDPVFPENKNYTILEENHYG